MPDPALRTADHMRDAKPATVALPSRRRLLVDGLKLGTSVGLLRYVGVGPSTAHAAPAAIPTAASSAERARRAYAALQAHFFLDRYSLYRDFKQTHPRLTYPYASNWSFSVAARASLALATAPGGLGFGGDVRKLLALGLERYWDPAGGAYNSEPLPPLGIAFGPDCFRFYDDNAHDALILLEYAEGTRDAWALQRAASIFSSFIIKGVDQYNPVMTGGIPWAQTPQGGRANDRNLISNAPSALLGFSLYQHTSNRHFFDWASGMLNWCNRYLRDTTDGLYWDKIRADGTIDYTKWSYNQGFMIAIYSKLYEITRDESFLRIAEYTARAALTHHLSQERNGIVGLLNQDPDFNAVFFRYLTRLLALSADRELQQTARQVMQAYADLVWETPQYHLTNDLFTLPCESSPLRMQAAMVEIYALQGG